MNHEQLRTALLHTIERMRAWSIQFLDARDLDTVMSLEAFLKDEKPSKEALSDIAKRYNEMRRR